MMHCKPELNPRTQEEQPVSSQPLAYSESQQHPRYMQRVEGPVLLFIHVVTPRYGTWDLHYMFAFTYRFFLLWAKVMAGVHLPGCSATQHPMLWLLSIWSLCPYGFSPPK